MRSGMGSTGLDWASWAALSCSVATLSEPPEVSEARFSSTWPPDDGRHHTFPAALHGGCDAEHPPRASTNPHCRRSLHSSTLNKRPPVSTIARSSTRHRWLVRGLSHVASGAQVRQAGRKQRAVHHLAHVRTHAMQRTRARVRARTTPAAPATDVYRAPRHPVTAARLAVAMECPGVAPSRGRRTFRVRVRPSPPEAHPPAALGRARHPASLAAPRALAPPRHGPRQGEPPARRASDRQRRQQSVRVQRVQTLESLLSLTGRVRVASPTRARGARATSVAAPATSRGREERALPASLLLRRAGGALGRRLQSTIMTLAAYRCSVVKSYRLRFCNSARV